MIRRCLTALALVFIVAPAVAQAPKKANPQQVADAMKALSQFGCKLHLDEKAVGSPVDLIWFPAKTNNTELARLVGHAARLPQLKALDLGETGIYDDALKALARLPNLESIYLDRTRISDSGIKHLAAIERLAWLDLSDTKVTAKSAQTLAQFKSLHHLFLSGASLSAEDVGWITTLNRLRSLGLESVPDESVKELSKLTDLKDLRFERLTKKGVPDLAKLEGLESLRLGGGLTYLDAGGWKTLTGMEKLISLNLSNWAHDDWKAYEKWYFGKKQSKEESGKKGKLPAFPGEAVALGDLHGLKKLDLTGIPVGDEIWKTVGKLAGLEELSVCCTQVTFEGAKDLASLEKLKELNARNCFVTERGLKSLEALKGLRLLYLYENSQITEYGVKQLQKALPQCRIYWKRTGGAGGHNFRLPGGYGG
jgi:hypothetical protein